MITSSHNAKIQAVRELLGRRKEREETGTFVVEGVRLAEEALQAGWLPKWALVSANISERGRALAENFRQKGVEVEEISPSLMDSLSDTETAPGLLAVIASRELPIPEALDFALVADAVRDPGNLGAILRSAAAAGVQGVFLAPGTVDAFAPKVLRAGMGAQFRLPLRGCAWEQIREVCKQRSRPLTLYLAEAGQGVSLWQADLRSPVALVVGGEAEGASAEGRAVVDQLITIPMPGKSESLNAAVAASILLFEAVRQRRA
jgi:TrmH family RNA methyltransferase